MSEIDTPLPDADASEPAQTDASSDAIASDTAAAKRRQRNADIRIGAAPTAKPAVAPPPKLTRRGRVSKWDRPPQPRDWRFFVGNLGKTLIAVGLLMFGFVAYQLWGTAIETAAAQNRLEDEFEELLEAVESDDLFESDPGTVTPAPDAPQDDPVVEPDVDPDPNAASDDTPDDTFTDSDEAAETEASPVDAVPVADQNIPLLENGDALARIEIPAIGVNDIVVAGVETGDLKQGPGHFPDTPLPGQLGNAAIAGHRTTYGQPFHNVDKLAVGDPIVVTTLSGVFTYRVTGQAIVQPSEYQVVATSDPTRANLTLTSCHPKFTARERIVIFSELDSTVSGQVGEPVINYGRPNEVVVPDEADQALPGEGLDTDEPATDADEPATDPVTGEPSGSASGNLNSTDNASELLGTDAVNEGIADAFSESWFSDPGANPQVGLWGLVVAAISMGAFALSRRTRNDFIGFAVGIAPFVVALYFFFQNVNRLLPPNL